MSQEEYPIPVLRPEVMIDDFEKIDIRVGKILSAKQLPKAKKPAYALEIDFGPLGIKHSSAQITVYYTPETLVGKRILAVVNFPPRRIAGFVSEVLTLGIPDAAGAVALIHPDIDAPLGSQLF